MKDVTFAIKTYERPALAERCVESILKYYPEATLLVGDDGKRMVYNGPGRLVLPHDIGLSAGRNALVKATTTKYVVILEDDFVFNSHTKIENLLTFVSCGIFDIAGGIQTHNGEHIPFEGSVSWQRGVVDLVANRKKGPTKVDVVPNFLLAKTETLINIQWDARLKMGEHLDFFMRCKQKGIKVGTVPAVSIEHKKEKVRGYMDERKQKAADCRELFCKKWNLTNIPWQFQ